VPSLLFISVGTQTMNKTCIICSKEYDNKRKQFLEKIGYKVLTIWEYDFKLDKQKVIKNIMELLDEKN